MSKKEKIQIAEIEELMRKGVHIGHLSRKWHPENKPLIIAKKRGYHILDPEKTVEGIKEAALFLNEVSREGGVVLFVGLKRQSADLVAEKAEETGSPYMSGRWVGGLLTNFKQVIKNVSKLKSLETGLDKGEFDYYTKKERLEIKREIDKLERDFGGVRDLEEPPQALVVASAKKGRTAVEEAQALDIPVVAVLDSDTKPDVDFAIPANDESLRALSLVLAPLFAAVKAGKEGKEITFVKKEKEEEFSETKEKKEASPLASLELGTRAENALQEAGIELGELRKMSKEALMGIKGIGKKTAEDIKENL